MTKACRFPEGCQLRLGGGLIFCGVGFLKVEFGWNGPVNFKNNPSVHYSRRPGCCSLEGKGRNPIREHISI